jgi:hypothetical protein
VLDPEALKVLAEKAAAREVEAEEDALQVLWLVCDA